MFGDIQRWELANLSAVKGTILSKPAVSLHRAVFDELKEHHSVSTSFHSSGLMLLYCGCTVSYL